jgi:hypothetical protein
LLENPRKIDGVIADMRATIAFLRKQGIIHFDAHFFNILTDGKRSYLTDFGLVLDKSFVLTPAEQSFYEQNMHYDYGELLWGLGFYLFELYQELSEVDKNRIAERIGLSEKAGFDEQMSSLLNRIDEVHADGVMKLDGRFVASLTKYRTIILLMNDFYSAMRKNNKKDTRLNHTKLSRLLKESGFVSNSASNH